MKESSKQKIIDKWLDKNGKKEIEKQVEKEYKEIEKQEKLTQQLFIGKVSEIIGFSKTVELLKECKETFKK
jgi:hypothetical protein